ncbi:MAG: isocitrate lyase/PEP mutase family protein [Pyramidobacter sp.]|nr:isocitrate lyase/PEP mutase family protein [Pyramidobacter sp.]
MYSKKTRATVLRELFATRKVVVAPAVGDALGARMVEDAGFPAVIVSGSSMSNLELGTSDVGIMSYGELRNNFVNILNACTIPVIVDADTGYGGTLPIYRMVREYEALDIAGIQIEDQIFPKMCAYYSNTAVASADEMIDRLRAVLEAPTNPDFFVIARTDAAKSLGFDEALRRAKLYYEAGADMIFITVPPKAEDMQRIADLPFPVCTSIVEGTVNEDFTVDQLAEMGFKLVKFPQTLIRASMRAMHDVLESLYETGGTKAYRDRIATQKQRGEYTHIAEWSDFQAKIEKKNSFKVDE